MPSGLNRRYGQGHLHFITCSCYRRLPLFASVRAKNLFIKMLGEVRNRYGFSLLGYVVMPEHIHLLISEPAKGTPSTVMQVLKQRVSRRLRRKPHNASAHQLRLRFECLIIPCPSSGNLASIILTSGVRRNSSKNYSICT
jgi:REP element-mobilizing transposase RayT